LSNRTNGVDLRQLRYFLAVAEELNFGRAAARIGIAGPSLSQQIMALERDLNVHLFERKHHSVTLTHAGQTLIPHVQALVAQADELRRLAGGLQCVEPVRLGLVDALPPDRVGLLSGVVPVNIDTWVLPSRSQAGRVSAGSLDLAICHLGTNQIDDLGLEAHLVWADRLHAISFGSDSSPVSAHDIAVLVDADTTTWLSWNAFAEEFADAIGVQTSGIEDGGLAGPAFLDHVRRSGRPVLNCPKGPKAPLPKNVVQRAVVGPAPLWTWSLVKRRDDDRSAVQAVVEALASKAPSTATSEVDLPATATWLPHHDPYRHLWGHVQ
jgi:DNA-binding transcriptional LysR family regulator